MNPSVIKEHLFLHGRGWVLALAIGLTMALSAQSADNPPDPHEPIKQLIDGNIKNALVANQLCIDYYKSRTAGLNPSDGLTGFQPTEILLAGYHLCCRAQILTMEGDTNGASKMIDEAEKFSNRWSDWYNSFTSGWPGIINATKGFYLEKTGDMMGAKNLYAAKPSSYGNARLAEIALSASKDEEARLCANKALDEDPKNATALAVTAALLEKEGHGKEALTQYDLALSDMIEESQTGHQFLPISVTECAKVKSAIERLKNNPKSSP